MLSCVHLFATPCTVALQAPLSMEFPRQEYWSGLPSLSLGDLPNPRSEPTSLTLAGGFLTTEPPRKPSNEGMSCQKYKRQLLEGNICILEIFIC